jgi:predicted HD superfamily hydrolase involved in NAD metabolism
LRLLFGPQALKARILGYLRERLPQPRFLHTLSVARLAVDLARRHGVSPRRAEWAALLHDASRTRLVFRSRREALGHAGRSAAVARRVFGIRDREILEAIAWHTVGSPDMGKLARILYVSDLASYDREFPEAARVRRLARQDLGAALRAAVGVKIRYLKRMDLSVHPQTRKLLASLTRGRS